MNALQHQIEKLGGSPEIATYYANRLAEFPENQWVRPTNALDKDPRGDAYTIFSHLYKLGLVQRQTYPIWRNGSFCGQRVSFLYRKDLNYADTKN